MIDVRPLADAEFERASAVLPLHRFSPSSTGAYLVAWDRDAAVGHVHVAWERTELGVPELQDMYVVPDRRREGVGAALAVAAEIAVAEAGHDRISLSVSDTNDEARRLYERLGYVRAPVPPKRVAGVVAVRDGMLEVDDTLLYFEKPVDFAPDRSS